jgi:hypothetical protein
MWAESCCAPLYASGAEFAVGCAPACEPAATRGGGAPYTPCSGTQHELHSERWPCPIGDVPAFVAGARSVLLSEGFSRMSDDEQRTALFGGQHAPAMLLSRYVALNVHAVCKFGTLEVSAALATPPPRARAPMP